MQKKPELAWTAPEFVHYPKSKIWFFVLGVAGSLLVVYFLFQRDFLTGMMFVLLLAMAFLFAKSKPRQINIALTAQGIKLNDTLLPYKQVKVFWMIYQPPEVKTLNFETSAYLNRFLTLQLEDQDPVLVRNFLLEYLPEDLDREERLSDKISRTLKF
ncbi:MAG: hypothetical protein A3G07_02295 [Candidatus Doudnabacteria bacterium RIFCSPLOWO2_12_FULL_47_12]|nr:MAG: hypothetical protein A3G07_02295 [Candidatus Doudnabacteria bacterium RIFCSPLOWO2_12_FULL_47_12]OHA39645.1 MAG: hypothetical protein A3I98_04025 [Candidatus Taylorbacteria bacterium RIFCSPLOWO2_02_FULL_45_10b]